MTDIVYISPPYRDPYSPLLGLILIGTIGMVGIILSNFYIYVVLVLGIGFGSYAIGLCISLFLYIRDMCAYNRAVIFLENDPLTISMTFDMMDRYHRDDHFRDGQFTMTRTKFFYTAPDDTSAIMTRLYMS